MKEIFETIKGYENEYLISNTGNVISLKSDIILKSEINKYGYCYINLCKNGNVKHFSLHRLVAKTFIPNPDNKLLVNHKDGNKQNNYEDNLEWVTHSENHLHAFKNDLRKAKGENHSQHKLTENDVLTIHGLYLSGLCSRKLGILFNISQTTILDIKNGKTWNYLTR